MDNQAVEKKSADKKVSKTKKVLSIIANVLMWAFIVFSVVITIFAFSAQSSADGIPTIGGKVISPVLSPSMSPTFNKGDIILSRKLADAEKYSLEVGQIITYKADLDGDGTPEINTHRIVEVITTSGGFTEYRTKGDNNQAVDNYLVSFSDVISVFDEKKDTRIAGLGSVINFLLQPTGFFIVIVIPLIIFFLFEIVMFVRKIMEVKNAGKKQITVEDEELIKQKAIEEYIRSQQKAAEEAKQEQPNEAPADQTRQDDSQSEQQ